MLKRIKKSGLCLGCMLIVTMPMVACENKEVSSVSPVSATPEVVTVEKPSYVPLISEEKETVSSKEDFKVDESKFIEQLENIFYYLESYQDRNVVVEGIFGHPMTHHEDGDAGEEICEEVHDPMVYRNSPGCCGHEGHDGFTGFVLKYEGNYPEEGDWVRVTGKPDVISAPHGGFILCLYVEKIEVLEERGLEFVTQ